GFLSIGRLLLCARKASLESFEFLLSFAIVSGVLYGVSIGVGQKALETDIYTKLFSRWNMLDVSLGLDAELAKVAICPTDDANPLDIFHRKGLDLLILVSDQTKAANATAIGEGDMAAIG